MRGYEIFLVENQCNNVSDEKNLHIFFVGMEKSRTFAIAKRKFCDIVQPP